MNILAVSDCVTLHTVPSLDIKDRFHVSNGIDNDKKPSEIATVRDSQLFVLKYSDERSYSFLTVKNVEGEDKILRVRKCTTGQQMSAIATPKKNNELAIGMASGVVRCVDIRTNKSTKSFSSEIPNNSVCWLDFNCDDKYLASVLDNGVTEILNVPNQIVSDRVKADKATTLARFHCLKPNWLAMASRQGIVSLYDLIYKKFLLKLNAHSSMTKDIVFDANAPDLLYSGSYDTTIKVHDMRRKYDIGTLKCDNPVHTILVGGPHVVAGTLGSTMEIFDVRNYKEPITRKNVGSGQIRRLTWVMSSETSHSFESTSTSHSDSVKSYDQSAIESSVLGKIKTRPSDVLQESRRRSSLKPIGVARLSADHGLLRLPNDSITEIVSPINPRMNVTERRRKTIKSPEDAPIVDPSPIVPANPIIVTPKITRNSKSLRRHEMIKEETEVAGDNKENKENLDLSGFNANLAKSSTPNVPQKVEEKVAEKVGANVEVSNAVLAALHRIEKKVDELRKDLEDTKLELKHHVDVDQLNVITSNFNFYQMGQEHREAVEAALLLLVNTVQGNNRNLQ